MREASTPPLAITTGEFAARPVAGPLATHFSTIWVHRLANREPAPVIIVPDATVDLQWIGGRLRLAGPDREPMTETLAPDTTVVGFRFRPGMAASWLGVPLDEVLSARMPLEDLWGRRAALFERPVQDAGSVEEVVSILEHRLAIVPPTPLLNTEGMSSAYDLVAAGPPRGTDLVAWLIAKLGMSERTLRRRFLEAYGYGPKTLQRIQRFNAYLKLAQLGSETAAALAAEAGYADQAHLIREARRLTGITPAQLEGSLSHLGVA
jgi:AraC-like DNA-binding protein